FNEIFVIKLLSMFTHNILRFYCYFIFACVKADITVTNIYILIVIFHYNLPPNTTLLNRFIKIFWYLFYNLINLFLFFLFIYIFVVILHYNIPSIIKLLNRLIKFFLYLF